MDEGSFEDVAGAFDKICAQAREALNKSAGALTAVHRLVFPKGTPPAIVEGLAEAFRPGTSTLANYARAQW